MGRAKFYDSDKVAITAFGSVIQGFQPDSKVKIERVSRSFSDEAGVDGEVSRSKLLDRRLKITFFLAQTSASNGFLSARLNLDENAPNGAGVGSVVVEDTMGGSIARGEQAWIEGWPEGEFGKVAKGREWVLMVADGVISWTGN